jgi:hypothetical protein
MAKKKKYLQKLSDCKEWNAVLASSICNGYYSKLPCLAHTANPKHEYCKEHQNILKELKNAKKC